MKSKKLDPYAELDVERGASNAEIRRAYRNKAKKAHPDKGGTPEQWESLSRALVVLTNPKKRATFDRTGDIEDDREDAEPAAARGLIHEAIMQFLQNFEAKGFAEQFNPSRLMILETIRMQIDSEIAQATSATAVGNKSVAFLKNFSSRFKRKKEGPDPLARFFEQRVEHLEEQLRGLESKIRIRNHAKAILSEYDFERDTSPMMYPTAQSFTMTNSTAW